MGPWGASAALLALLVGVLGVSGSVREEGVCLLSPPQRSLAGQARLTLASVTGKVAGAAPAAFLSDCVRLEGPCGGFSPDKYDRRLDVERVVRAGGSFALKVVVGGVGGGDSAEERGVLAVFLFDGTGRRQLVGASPVGQGGVDKNGVVETFVPVPITARPGKHVLQVGYEAPSGKVFFQCSDVYVRMPGRRPLISYIQNVLLRRAAEGVAGGQDNDLPFGPGDAGDGSDLTRADFDVLVETCLHLGLPSAVTSVSDEALRRGIYSNKWQRPTQFLLPGLTAKPFHGVRRSKVAAALEKHAGVIQHELEILEHMVMLHEQHDSTVDGAPPTIEDGKEDLISAFADVSVNAPAITSRGGLKLNIGQGIRAASLEELWSENAAGGSPHDLEGYLLGASEGAQACGRTLHNDSHTGAGGSAKREDLGLESNPAKHHASFAAGFEPVKDARTGRPQFDEGNWTQFMILKHHEWNPLALQVMPKTVALLDQAFREQADADGDVSSDPFRQGALGGPVSGSIFLSRMSPKSHIRPHTGATNAKLRLHLPLRVPVQSEDEVIDPEDVDVLPLAWSPKWQGTAHMRIGNLIRLWKNGKVTSFDDTFEHECWNDHDQGDRVILVVDVWHPDVAPETRALLRDDEDRFREFAALRNL